MPQHITRLDDKKEEMLNLFRGGTSLVGLSRLYGVSPTVIRRLLRKAGHSFKKNKVRIGDLMTAAADIISMYESGASIKSMCEKYGTNRVTLRSFLNTAGVSPRKTWSRHPGSLGINKLSDADKADLLTRYVSGVTMEELSDVYDVSLSSVWAYINEHEQVRPTGPVATVDKLDNAMRKYGISREIYDRMLSEQSGACAVCRKPPEEVGDPSMSRLCVDHDHETGKVRGLLCQACNKAVGFIREDISNARSLVAYLEKHTGNPSQPCYVSEPTQGESPKGTTP